MRTLERGLARACADDLMEVMVNLEDNTCHYIEIISLLEEVAKIDWFHYFDDFSIYQELGPEPDPTRKESFRALAEKSIANIHENHYHLKSDTLAHRALTTNSTYIIKNSLLEIKANIQRADRSIIPILEKIVRKDVYKSYFYGAGLKTDTYLGRLALEIIQKMGGPIPMDQSPATKDEAERHCEICVSLGNDISIYPEREQRFPEAYSKLIYAGKDPNGDTFYRCPGCNIYFENIYNPQMYGSGMNDEDRLIRQTAKRSMELHKLLS